ncbi:MAG: PEP-CTERM sorting domain-containing protein [Verrucomicrobiia bacterium]
MKNKKLVSAAALIAASLSAAQAQSDPVIAAWNFENDAVAVNNSPAPSTGVGTASSIGMNIYPTPNIGVTTDDVLVGKASDSGANGLANTSQTWRVRAQAGANGAANGWSSLAPIGTQGAVFAASTVGYDSINVSFDWYATTQGEANLQAEYTTDGINWINAPITIGANASLGLAALNNSTSPNTVFGSYISDNLLNNGSMAGQDWFQGLTVTIADPNAANDPNFAIEFVNASTGADDVSTQGTALNNSSGNWRFDNIVISGTLTVPEPSTLGLAGLGLASLFALRQRNRKA